MAGYTRQDTANNIANGNVIDADDLDSEFNAVEDAFQASSGHSHDGSAGEGAPITKVGPSQDIIVGTTTVLPKANNIIDLGSSAAQYKDGYFDGTLYADTVNAGVNGYTTIEDNEYAVSTGGLTFDVAGDITLDADGGDIMLQDGGTDFGKLTNRSNQLSIYSGTVESLRLNGADVDALGTLDVTGNTTVGGTMTVTGDTSISSGNLTVNTGNVSIGGTLGVTGTITGTLSGTVSSISNHDTGDLTEGSNLYYTTARARSAISVSGDLSYDSNTGVISTQGLASSTTDDLSEGSTNLYYTDTRVQSYISGNRSYGNITSTGNVIVQGNLTVSGTTTTVNTETINLADNVITLNSNETGTPSQNGGIEVERGTATNKTFVWDEAADKWTVGSETIVAATFEGNASTASTLQTGRTISLTGDVTGSVSFNGGSNVSITTTVADDSHNHTISNVDGLQTALNGKAALAGSSSQNFSANRMLVGNGSATSPSIGFTSDGGQDTGFYWGGDGNIYFTTNGVYAGKIDPSNNLTMVGNVTAYSDERLKSDIVTIPDALEKVKALRGVNYTKDGEASTGVIAQEVQKVIPEVVQQNEEYLSVAYGNLVGVLIEAVKELSAEVEALKAK